MKGFVPRTVLDANVLISALLFRGSTNMLVPIWQQGKIRPLVSKAVLIEYFRALSFPKFGLSKSEVSTILKEGFLIYADPVVVNTRLFVVAEDPDDDKFLELAVDGRADVLVSGDSHLLDLGEFRGIPIVRASRFLENLQPA